MALTEIDKKILVVDDEPLIIDFFKAYLEHHDFDVVTAIDGKQALKKLSEESIDLVITDHTMPEMSGIELSKEAKRLYPELRIILNSGHSDSFEVDNFESYGIDHFCKKPASGTELLKTVHHLLSK